LLHQLQFGIHQKPEEEIMSTVLNRHQVATEQVSDRERVFDLFRRLGYLQADLDPLRKELIPLTVPELEVSGPTADEARRYYSGTIGAEFMHIPDPEQRQWIINKLESAPAPVDREFILKRLVQADVFEQVLQSRYLGTKRFSLEGVTVLIPLLDAILQGAIEHEDIQAVIGMSHRGRLNIIAHVVGRNPADVFAGFEDVDPRSVLGGGDVKYHQGATGVYTGRDGRTVKVHLVSNPSHLEAVDPVVMGRTRAKQMRLGGANDPRILPITMHGDAAFAGQGIWAETLNLAQLEGFTVGGALHIIANNLIGFTAVPKEIYSSRFASDLAKRLAIPIFHVNAEDPEAVVRVGRIALEYRYKFQSDVVIDVIGYRRHGHSEVEDPSITQPVLYRKIKDHPPLSTLYADRIAAEAESFVTEAKSRLESAQEQAKGMEKRPFLYELPPYWSAYVGGCHKREYEVSTGVSAEDLRKLTESITSYPDSFHIHPKMRKLLQQRHEMGTGKRPVDYGMAEALAFGTLVAGGTPVRLTGQDTRRGTFNQRHAVLLDVEDEHTYVPLEHVSPNQARFEVYNTELSEAAVMGFEYGYSRDYPDSLVAWEAQFGDFANGGQIIIDQFISSSEDKWGLLSGLVLLLPHGYEGQGPVR
jgi:2-oxoglutarate dehydrogenase E1 component